jgi:hypothetical protein
MRSEMALSVTLLITLFPGTGQCSFQHMMAAGRVEVTEDTLVREAELAEMKMTAVVRTPVTSHGTPQTTP